MSRDLLRKTQTPSTSDHRWLPPAGPLWQPKPVRPETSASGNGGADIEPIAHPYRTG
jgi:hypothetical protein